MYTLVISSYWYIMHIVLLLLGVKPSIFLNYENISKLSCIFIFIEIVGFYPAAA